MSAEVAGGKIDRDDMVELVEGYGGVADLPAGLVGRVLALDELAPERASEDVPAGLYVHVSFPRRGSVAVPVERLRLVLKARGEYVPVESIRKGDQVWLPGAGRLAEAGGDADASRVHFVCVSLVGVRIGLHERPGAQVRVVRRAS